MPDKPTTIVSLEAEIERLCRWLRQIATAQNEAGEFCDFPRDDAAAALAGEPLDVSWHEQPPRQADHRAERHAMCFGRGDCPECGDGSDD